jgi:putative hydrolase of the HAD superfamily
MNTNSIEVVLFDLGGVIVQFQDPGYLAKLLGESDDASALAKWILCPSVQAYESGNCDRYEFANGIVEYFELAADPDEFLSNFLAWPQDVFPGSKEIVSAIHPEVRVGCLSNTSEFHWGRQKSAAILQEMFELRFLSYEMGQLKPDPEIYQTVARQLDCAASSILFFDDHPKNIAGARAVGFEAHLTKGIREAQAHLQQYGLIK